MLQGLKLSLVFCLSAGFLVAQEQPNILFIMADDLGYGDLGSYGAKDIRTPHIDGLAARGVRFTQAYAAAPVCTPSRTACMTGLYPARTEVGLMEPLDWTAGDSLIGLSAPESSVPALLRKAGYQTALVGKWHLGFQSAFGPRANGFDYFFGYNGGGIDYVSHTDPNGQPDLYENETAVTRQGYLTDILADEAIRYISERSGQSGKPFFLSLQFNAPHWPWQSRSSGVYPQGNDLWKEGGSRAVYVQMVEQMDEAVGRILEALTRNGQDKNTVVVFTSDNGGERFSYSGGLRDKKMTLWEGGIRVPAIIRWPGRISPGMVSGQPLIHMDLAASFLAVAGVHDMASKSDGISLWPLIAGTGGEMRRRFYWRVTQRRQQAAMRDGPWKYLRTEEGEFLFNLEEDPWEQTDLKAGYALQCSNMRRWFDEWEKEMLAPRPLK